MNNYELFDWIQQWYQSQCNGDWEHDYGIDIKTVDNPGWYIKINLTGTLCELKDFESIEIENNSNDWYFCLKRENNFEASCSPTNLTKILEIFRLWVESKN